MLLACSASGLLDPPLLLLAALARIALLAYCTVFIWLMKQATTYIPTALQRNPHCTSSFRGRLKSDKCYI